MEKKWLVCIESNTWYDLAGQRPENSYPIEGEIYTFDGQCEFNKTAIYLSEFRWTRYGYRVAWGSDAFRPVDMSFGKETCESIERQPVKQLA